MAKKKANTRKKTTSKTAAKRGPGRPKGSTNKPAARKPKATRTQRKKASGNVNDLVPQTETPVANAPESKPEDKKTITDSVKETGNGFVKMVKDGFNAAKELIVKGWNATKRFFAGIWEAIKTIASKIADFFKGFFNKDSLEKYSGLAQIGFLGLLGLTALLYVGGVVFMAYGFTGLAIGSLGGFTVAYGVNYAANRSGQNEENKNLAEGAVEAAQAGELQPAA